MKNKKSYSIDELLNIMDELREKCPWDKEQTMDSLKILTIEESYELTEAIDEKNYEEIKNELGDLLLHIIFYSKIASETSKFNFNDVVENITKKMIFRHPHVFKNRKFKNLKDFKLWWENSKNKKQNSILDNIPVTLPALQEANKIQKKVAAVGFEYSNDIEAIEKVNEELNELKKEIKIKNKKKIREELGDLIFAVLDVSRKLKLDPESVLKQSNRKFSKRWKKLEKHANKKNLELQNLSINEYNKIWNKVKKN